MSKRSNTFPYTNAAEAGRTHYGKIEIRDPKPAPRPYPNRAVRRANGVYRGVSQPAPYRQVRSLRTEAARIAAAIAEREALKDPQTRLGVAKARVANMLPRFGGRS